MIISVLCIIAVLFVFAPVQAAVEVGVACLVGDTLAPGITGHVYFVTVDSHDVWVWANISGIPDGSPTRGLHIHEFGDITGPTALFVGSHYQGAFTGSNVHGCEFNTTRHEGDMGNWNVTGGSISQSKTISMLSISGGYSAIGRAVVLHNETDNCVSISSSGSRLAQGVIGIANLAFLPDEVAAKVGTLTAANSASSGGGSSVASALLTPISGSSVNGFVTFTQDINGVTVKAKISGLSSNNAYGFHIHIFGDLSSNDGNAAGSHYNPYNVSHGLAPNLTRHVGDLGNICTYGDDGYAYYSYTFTDGLISLSGNSIIGRSVLIHAIRDDGGSVFGSRIAQGLIGGFNVTNDIVIPSDVTPNPPSCDSFIPPPFVPEIGVVRLDGSSYDTNITGYVYFVTLNSSYVWVWANISGITCHTEDIAHGIHVHTFGDVTDLNYALNVGSHFVGNGQSVHGCENTNNRHEGDMGNWNATMGNISQSKIINLLALTGGYSIIGRAVILHNSTDNCIDTGSAGNRLAQGVIGIANPDPKYLPAEVAAVAQNPTFNNATNGENNVNKAIAYLTPISGNSVQGLVTFEQVNNVVVVKASITGLDRTSAYGFHIHIYGDLSSEDGLAASSHYNPHNSAHGLAPSPTRHVGDLGNICTYGPDGTAYYSYNFTDLVLLSGNNNIVGRNVIIHSIRDDGGSSYGSRIAQGVIGIGNETATTTVVTFPPDLVFAAPSCQNFAPYTNGPEVGVARVVGDTLDTSIDGYVYFVTLNSSYVYVWANISGITSLPDQPHGLHVHTLGDITGPTGLHVGGHYVGVYGYDIHSCEGTTPRHQGDMGNWTATGGVISQAKIVDLLALSGSFSIIGRSVILHNRSDDCQSTSSAGERLAQGVIGIANPAYLPPQVYAAAKFIYTGNNAAYGPDSSVTIALAVLTPISGSSVTGLVTFEQIGSTVLVKASVKGLDISQAYGFHIHTYGDLNSTDGMAASSHYNPYNSSHGIPTNNTRHVGDLGNICSFGMDGTAYYSFAFSDLLTLYGPFNIMGRNVIIHAIRDDGGSVYGDRIAQGVIGLGSSSTSIEIPSGITIHPPSCTPIVPPPATTGATTGVTTGKSTTTTGSGTSDNGGAGNMSPAGKAVLAIFVIAIVGGLLVAGYFYAKNGHLLGYTFSKKGIRPVRTDDYVAFTDKN